MKKQGFMNRVPAKRAKTVCAALLAAAFLWLLISAGITVSKNTAVPAELYLTGTFKRAPEAEEENEEAKYQTAIYYYDNEALDGNTYLLYTDYTAEEYEALPADATVEGCVYKSGDDYITFEGTPTEKEVQKERRSFYAGREERTFGVAMACALTALGLCVMIFFGRHFTDYEQLWFLSILVLAAVFSLLFPEEEANGVNGLIIMALYLLDTFLNILCELLISKQSKWNFIVSVFVEITEIVICLVLMYRFATMATTLLFWLPCDIISFINWHRHPDKQEEELTVVRTLKGWQEALIIAGIVIWTVVVGYFLSHLDFMSDFIQNRTLEVILAYVDACASAVGVVNGVFILLRLREQWIAWYICAALEAAINILSGQFVLLILKLGYFTNTTYGYIKWTKYIRGAQAAKEAEPAGKE